MKKILKKATMLLCAMVVTIGFVGGTVEEASAATRYGGKSKITLTVPSYNFSMGKVVIKDSAGNTVSTGVDGVPSNKYSSYTRYTTKKSEKTKLTVTYYNDNGKKVDSDSVSVKISDLGKKHLYITFKKSGNNLSKVYIDFE